MPQDVPYISKWPQNGLISSTVTDIPYQWKETDAFKIYFFVDTDNFIEVVFRKPIFINYSLS